MTLINGLAVTAWLYIFAGHDSTPIVIPYDSMLKCIEARDVVPQRTDSVCIPGNKDNDVINATALPIGVSTHVTK